MKVHLDDVRPPPDGSWTWAKTFSEAVALIDRGDVDEISLDHDLADFGPDGRERTGYDVVMHMVERWMADGVRPPVDIRVHSANSVAAPRMREVISRYLTPGGAYGPPSELSP